MMTTRSGAQRSHLASSPFKPKPEPEIETYALDDRVCHESYGLGAATTSIALVTPSVDGS